MKKSKNSIVKSMLTVNLTTIMSVKKQTNKKQTHFAI